MNSDHPVESCSEDALERASFARHVANQLAHAPIDHSIVFGLYGPWGSGKTSILNMICEELESPDNPPIVVKFNPWNYPSSENLVTAFLALLSECIWHEAHSPIPLKTSRKLIRAIKRYSDVLASTADAFNWVPGAGVVSTVLRLAGKEGKKSASPAALKSRLSKLLLDTNTRVVVIIDDLDRLSNEAVRSVFQLVAAVADFPGVNYLLAYDLNNVTRALEAVQGCEGERYLEKIVQIPIELHEPNPGRILELFSSGLNELLSSCEFNVNEKSEMRNRMQLVSRRIKTVRDLRRLLNVFEVDLAESFGRVAPADLLVMSSLRLFAPKLFPWISARRYELTGGVKDDYNPDQAKERRDRYKREIHEILDGDDEAESYVFELLCKVFPRFENAFGVREVSVSEVSLWLNWNIACPEILDRYLSGLLELYSFPRDGALRLVKTGSVDELETFFAKGEGGVSSTVLSAAVELAPVTPATQLENITRALLRSGAGNSKDPALRGLFSVFGSSLESLLRTLGMEAASKIIIEETQGRTFLELAPLAELIYAQELAYARLGGEVEKPDEQLITLQSLIIVEENIVRSLRDTVVWPLDLEDNGASQLLCLWRGLDADSYERHVTDGVLRDPLGYALYAVWFLETNFSSEGHGWALPNRLPGTIDITKLCFFMNLVAKSEFFRKLSLGTQRLVAALSVCAEKAVNGANGTDFHLATASKGEVERRLRSWGGDSLVS